MPIEPASARPCSRPRSTLNRAPTAKRTLDARRRTLLATALVFLAACGEPRLDSHTPLPVSEEEQGQTFVPAEYWVSKHVTTTVVDIPFLENLDWLAAQSTSYYLEHWTVEGTTITAHEELCRMEIEEVMGTQTIIPPQFYDCCSHSERTGSLTELAVGAEYSAPDLLTVYGADLEDPWTEPLPEDGSDARVLDTDADGHPGITSIIDGWIGDGYAEVYVAQRTITDLVGTLVRQDRLEGHIYMGLEQTILGASEGDDWATQDGFQSKQDGVPEHNFFIVQALSGPVTCEELLADPNFESLFE